MVSKLHCTFYIYDCSHFIALSQTLFVITVSNRRDISSHVHSKYWLCRVVSGFHGFGILHLQMKTKE